MRLQNPVVARYLRYCIKDLHKELRCSCTEQSLYIRGCTGFDGGFEIAEAIRRLGLRHQLRIKNKRKRKLRISCLMQLVDLKQLAA